MGRIQQEIQARRRSNSAGVSFVFNIENNTVLLELTDLGSRTKEVFELGREALAMMITNGVDLLRLNRIETTTVKTGGTVKAVLPPADQRDADDTNP
jgi:hypothetical protein